MIKTITSVEVKAGLYRLMCKTIVIYKCIVNSVCFNAIGYHEWKANNCYVLDV